MNELPKPEHGFEIVGPFTQHRVAVDGYGVPKLEAVETIQETENGAVGEVHFTLDNRFGLTVPTHLAHSVAWFIANALAIGAGYSCHGENSQKSNPYKCRMVGLGETAE